MQWIRPIHGQKWFDRAWPRSKPVKTGFTKVKEVVIELYECLFTVVKEGGGKDRIDRTIRLIRDNVDFIVFYACFIGFYSFRTNGQSDPENLYI